ncbi:cytochrome P450 [Bradyrhizobium zhanjiangense]|uniref:cytochrome P450 n=1 Tax=Bradyrhizobium zhanjiangense TaxID=1325107 RepID=UPI0013E89E13|nr:cytochrome P450 [Bradyrhizobium zhanjiangense]
MPRYRDKHVIPVINDAIDRFASRGSAELVRELADEVPSRVMGSLFDLPWRGDALMANIFRWHRDIVACVGMKYTGEQLTRKAKAASDELNQVLLPRVLERRGNRGDDFISWFWSRAEEEYGEVGVEVVLAHTRELALGAGETTANAIANTIYLLLSEPAVRETVTKDQEGALSALVEETLRLDHSSGGSEMPIETCRWPAQ